MRLLIAAALFALLLAQPANAEVQSSSPGGFVIQAESEVAASPEDAWRAVTRLNRWWNGSHAYSGDARNLSFEPRAGGCWCERWDRQSVEHGRVVLVMEHEGVRTLRIAGALGPLQELAVNGVLTFTVAPLASGAKIEMTYRVSGDTGVGLEGFASPVNQVLMEQFGRLNRYTVSGSPD